MPTLKDIAKLLVQKHELKQRDADAFVSAFVDTILDGLKNDRQVKIKGFGTFKVTSVRDRESVNVNTGERVIISGHDKISFTPDAVMRDIVNKPFAQFETVVLADGVNFEDMPETSEANAEVEEPKSAPVIEEPTAVVPEVTPQEAPVIIPLVPKHEDKPVVEVEEKESEQAVVEDPKEEVVPVEETPELVIEEAAEPTIEKAKPVIEEAKPMIETVGTTENTPEPVEEEAEQATEAEEEDDDKTDCKKVFVLYAVVANILIAAIAFVLGYLCATNNWLGLDKNAEKDAVQPAEYIETDTVQEQKTNAVAADTTLDKAVTDSLKAQENAQKEAPASSAPATEKTPEQNKQDVKSDEKSVKQDQKQTKTVSKAEPSKPQQTVAAGKYDSDPRVRTGAYTIVGTAKTVKVRAGQTLKSISKTYLGEGMECYVEAYNGGITHVSEGQTIKIPELQLKKRKK